MYAPKGAIRRVPTRPASTPTSRFHGRQPLRVGIEELRSRMVVPSNHLYGAESTVRRADGNPRGEKKAAWARRVARRPPRRVTKA